MKNLLRVVIVSLLVAIPAFQVLAAPEAGVTLDVPAEVPIGSSFSFDVTFDNTNATDTGYGPFIDLIFPVNGADGNGNTSSPLDGIDFVGATYLGVPVTTVVQTFPDGPLGGICGAGQSQLDHPYAVDTSHQPLPVCGTPGDKLVTI